MEFLVSLLMGKGRKILRKPPPPVPSKDLFTDDDSGETTDKLDDPLPNVLKRGTDFYEETQPLRRSNTALKPHRPEDRPQEEEEITVHVAPEHATQVDTHDADDTAVLAGQKPKKRKVWNYHIILEDQEAGVV